MSALGVILLVVFLIGAALGIYAIFAPRRRAARGQPEAQRFAEPEAETTDWTSEAGDEFSGLSESARCEMIFAVATLDHERPQRLLEYALGDPSETVALAAAHALARNGRKAIVERYLESHPGERAGRIAQTLALLDLG